jgi:hypothetical protein
MPETCAAVDTWPTSTMASLGPIPICLTPMAWKRRARPLMDRTPHTTLVCECGEDWRDHQHDPCEAPCLPILRPSDARTDWPGPSFPFADRRVPGVPPQVRAALRGASGAGEPAGGLVDGVGVPEGDRVAGPGVGRSRSTAGRGSRRTFRSRNAGVEPGGVRMVTERPSPPSRCTSTRRRPRTSTASTRPSSGPPPPCICAAGRRRSVRPASSSTGSGCAARGRAAIRRRSICRASPTG